VPDDYSLNFLWVHLNPQDRIKGTATSIFVTGLNTYESAGYIKDPKLLGGLGGSAELADQEAIGKLKNSSGTFAYRTAKWADVHPAAHINIWYDSALVQQSSAAAF